MTHKTVQLMKQFGLTSLGPSPETARAFELFKKRTRGMQEVAWQRAFSPSQLQTAMDQYGFDCYTQGCLDGASACKVLPSILEHIPASQERESNESR